jgi:hypothetical protein
VDKTYNQPFKSPERPEMYGAANLELQTATNETLNVLTVQFDQFKTEVIANFREVGKRLICYDCAWLSLTALSTVTRNLWL